MNCERCNKRLSRKSARLIDGKVLCAVCMFASPAKADRNGNRQDTAEWLGPKDESGGPDRDLPKRSRHDLTQ